MGFQGKVRTGEIEYNKNANAGAAQRTSNVSKYSQNTTKAQYDRHQISTNVDSRGKTADYNTGGSPQIADNQLAAKSSFQRTSGVSKLCKSQHGYGEGNSQFTKTGPMDVNE